jgi:hypothetical protein
MFHCGKWPLVFILVSLLVADPVTQGSDSVRDLLRKPRTGEARINLRDGTHVDGTITRVTDQFLTVNGPRACENVEISRIASVKWLGPQDENFVVLIPYYLMIGSVLAPLAVIEGFRRVFGHDSMFGAWEPVDVSAGRIVRIELREPGQIIREEVMVRRGHYEMTGGQLQLKDKANGTLETIPLRFVCDQLILEQAAVVHTLRTQYPQLQQATNPIIGTWLDGNRTDGHYWDFSPSGEFTIWTQIGRMQGSFEKTKTGIRVTWANAGGTRSEDWLIRRTSDHLVMTEGGKTTEYQRAGATP